jgi:hypothetical protein
LADETVNRLKQAVLPEQAIDTAGQQRKNNVGDDIARTRVSV